MVVSSDRPSYETVPSTVQVPYVSSSVSLRTVRSVWYRTVSVAVGKYWVCLQVTDAVGPSRIRSLNHEHGPEYLFAHV